MGFEENRDLDMSIGDTHWHRKSSYLAVVITCNYASKLFI
jgi:hypothetical protein